VGEIKLSFHRKDAKDAEKTSRHGFEVLCAFYVSFVDFVEVVVRI